MQQRHVELIKNLYQAFAAGDIPAVLQSFDENIGWTEAEGFSYGGTYRGGESVLQNIFMKLATEWSDFKAEPDEFLDAGENIVALGNYSGSYKTTAAGRKERLKKRHLKTSMTRLKNI